MSLITQKSKIYLVPVGLLLAALMSFAFFATPIIRTLYSLEDISAPIIAVREGIQTDRQYFKFNMIVWNLFKTQRFPTHPLPFSLTSYDFALIQEDILPKRHKDHEQFFFDQSWVYFMPTFKKRNEINGTSLISKKAPTQIRGFITEAREPIVQTPKSFIVADFDDLRVINVHAINFVTTKEWLKSMREIFNYSKDKDHVVLAGDFNTWNQERLDQFRSLIVEFQLQEVVFEKDHRSLFQGFVVDYVLAKGLKLRSAVTMPLSHLSDHNPMEVTFEKIEVN